MKKIDVIPLSDVLGAEIRGVDLKQPIDAETLAAIEAAWLEHLVVVFRDQDLNEDDHTRFCEYFGPLDRPSQSPSQDDAYPHIMFISNVRDAGKRTTLEDGEMMFHTDRVFAEFPFMATTLYAIEVPSHGGDTLFSNCYSAYDALPDDLKSRLDGCRAHNIYDYENNATLKTMPNRPDAPGWSHPVFRTHPATGRKAIYVNRLMTDHVVDMDPDESRELLERVFDFAERDEFVYAHAWRPGDLLMWDNRCTMHARTDFDPGERRMMRRITICGDLPF